MASLFETLLGGYGAYEQLQNLKDLQSTQQQYIQDLTPQVTEAVQFKPFTVTTSTGQVTTTPEGGYTTQLTPEQQALQNMLFGGASQFLGQAQQPIAQTEQNIYNRMLEIATPERQRQQLGLEERLAAQGRLGTSSAAYGGATPEQLALATAQEQQLNQLGLQARNQALAEQQQAAQMGQGMLAAGYMPQSQMLNLLQPAVNLSNLVGTGAREGAGLMSQLGLGGLSLQTELEKQRGDLMSQLYATLGGAAGGLSNISTGNTTADKVLDFFFGG